jgi:hypothetical protein
VAVVYVGGQFVKQVPLVWNALGSTVPEVVMRIADGKLRLQSRFLG